jgi:hypothetical protein
MVLQVDAAPTSVIQAFRRPILVNMEPGRRRMPGSSRPDISTTTARCRGVGIAAASVSRRHRPRGDIGPAATSARTPPPRPTFMGGARGATHDTEDGAGCAPRGCVPTTGPVVPSGSEVFVPDRGPTSPGPDNRCRDIPKTPPSGSRHMTAVRARGLEPPPPLGDRDLNPARLPIPPRPQRPRRAGEQGVYGGVPTDAPSAH